ncbi:MAG: META domain-containing protein, partial [Anaerolineales bacterium]|nr:META domain-containing protein [Anaerolineales bacterium]
ADFGEDGQLTGNASCNNYFASYETEDDNITIGPAGSTRMACPEPEGIMEQEQQYLAALETAATYKITGLAMEMRTSEGSLVATFKRAVLP